MDYDLGSTGLKPCPNCATETPEFVIFHERGYVAWKCRNCGTIGPGVIILVWDLNLTPTHLADLRIQAAQLWNSRPREEAMQLKILELEKLYKNVQDEMRQAFAELEARAERAEKIVPHLVECLETTLHKGDDISADDVCVCLQWIEEARPLTRPAR